MIAALRPTPPASDVGRPAARARVWRRMAALGPARAARFRRLRRRARRGAAAARGADELRELRRRAHDSRRRAGAAVGRARRGPERRPRRTRRSATATCRGGALERRGRGLRRGELRRPAGDLPRTSAAPRRRAERVVDCWASFFSERALFYRCAQGLARRPAAWRSWSSGWWSPTSPGVLFTIDPVARRRDQMVVEAVFGLGEAVVVRRADARPLRRWRATAELQGAAHRAQPYAIVRAPRRPRGARSCRRRAARARRSRTTSSRLWRSSAGRSRSTSAAPQDIEWAIAGGELYVLQSRPVTTL